MLQKIQHYTRGWVAGVIIGLIAVTFVFFGVSNYIQTRADTSVASVNGDDISKNELKQAYQRLRRQLAQRLGDLPINATFEQQLRKQALQNLITFYALKQAAVADGYHLSMQQVDNVIMQLPVFQEQGRFSPQRFQQQLRASQQSELEFMQQAQSSLLIDQLRNGLMASEFVLPYQVDNVIKLTQQTRDFRYLVIPTKYFIKQIKVTDAQIKEYYAKHSEQFTTPEEVSLQYIELSLEQLQQNISLSKELRDYYDAHKANFRKPKQWQVAHILVKASQKATPEQLKTAKEKSEKIRKQLEGGADFSSLAKSQSDDKLSAQKGGQLPWFIPGMMDAPFEQAVLALSKVGDMSPVVKTKYGYDIIKLLAVKQPQQRSFAEVKSRIATMLKQQKAQQQFAEISEELSNLTYSNPDTLKVAADTLNLPLKTTAFFTRDGEQQGLLSDKKIINAAFSDDVLQQGNNSEFIQRETAGVVLRIKEHRPAKQKPLAIVAQQIRTQLTKQTAQEEAAQLGHKMLAELNNSQFKMANYKTYELKWKNEKNIKRMPSTLDNNIVQAAFRMPHPTTKLSHPNSGLPLANGDYALVQLSKVTDGNAKEANKAQRDNIAKQLTDSQGAVTYDLYVASVMKHVKIKTNP